MVREPKKGKNNVSSENRTLSYYGDSACMMRTHEAEWFGAGIKAKASKKAKKEKKPTQNEAFFAEFAEEIDLFALQQQFPEWIYDFREEILHRVNKTFRVMCQYLKDDGIKFYMKYPIEINGKWKFADVFIPERKLVVLLLNDTETMGLPCHSKTDREIWFGDRYKTIGICTYEVNRTIDKIKQYYGRS